MHLGTLVRIVGSLKSGGAIVPGNIEILGAIFLSLSVGPAIAKEREPVLTISPAKQKALAADYFNCDHEGSFGCLQADCTARGADKAEIQYLYRDVWQNFPEMLTPALRACYVRAGGRFR